MSARPFFDTNILVYAFSSQDPRMEKALSLVASGEVVSIQVLSEFANVSRQKLFREWNEIEDAIGAFKTLLEPPLPLTMEIHQAAIGIARNYNYHFYAQSNTCCCASGLTAQSYTARIYITSRRSTD